MQKTDTLDSFFLLPSNLLSVFLFFLFRQGFFGAPAAAGRRENKQQVPLLACSLTGGELVPYIG